MPQKSAQVFVDELQAAIGVLPCYHRLLGFPCFLLFVLHGRKALLPLFALIKSWDIWSLNLLMNIVLFDKSELFQTLYLLLTHGDYILELWLSVYFFLLPGKGQIKFGISTFFHIYTTWHVKYLKITYLNWIDITDTLPSLWFVNMNSLFSPQLLALIPCEL